MGTQYFAIVEQQHSSGHWGFVSLWSLGKVFELRAAIEEINPAKHEYKEWSLDPHRVSMAFGWERYWKTELAKVELPRPCLEYGEAYASMVASLEPLTEPVRVLFCQDQ